MFNKYTCDGSMTLANNNTTSELWIKLSDVELLIKSHVAIKNAALTRINNRISQEIKVYNHQSYFMQQGLRRAQEFVTSELTA